ncbi:MAG TPA: restriction endonuclease [Burkholderiales bacterium]|nr:restriction endonuclease [Burkholderiales bacterium]
MARKNQGLFDDLIEIISKFPWWVGVVLAIVTYSILHSLTNSEISGTPNIKDIGSVISTQMFRSFATIGQYLLPAVFLIGSLVSVFERQKRNVLHDQVAAGGVQSTLEKMPWRGFEMLVGEFFRRRGFSVTETGSGGADGGVDLVVSRGADRYFVQCKQWKARQVGVEIVRELYGVMAAGGAAGGYVITSGVFTDEAQRFAEGREISLITGDQLADLIRMARTTVPKKDFVTADNSPFCPKCGSPMVMRAARQGPRSGSSFWGCSKFPNCRGTRPA